MTEKRRYLIFLLVTFGGGWLLMALGMLLGGFWYQPCVALAMFAPLLGVLLSHGGLKRARTGICWKAEIPGHFPWYILAWLGPGVLSLLCAALFFLLLPGHFDRNMSYLTAQIPAGTELPMPLWALAVIQLLEAVTYAPLVNMFLAVGEETGWRGFQTPYLCRQLGRRKGLLLSGAVWGAWHWPLILCGGYEYGTGYWGAPYTGMLLMCAGTTALGILLTFLYEKAGSIWAPALAHGAINAAAGIGVLFLHGGETSLFLGPTPLGLVSGIPLFLLALAVLLRQPAPEKP